MTLTNPVTTEPVSSAVEAEALRELYRSTRTIAVMGASADPAKEAHTIPAYLAGHGYQILAVSPRGGELFGAPVAAELADVSADVDVVDVFRPPAEADAVAEAAAAVGATVLWFQPGTHTDTAVRLAARAGLVVVTDRCMGATHARLGLGPGPLAGG